VTCCNIKHHSTSNLTFDGTINGLVRKQQNSVYRLCRFQLRSGEEVQSLISAHAISMQLFSS
jgi:hypothetical protein